MDPSRRRPFGGMPESAHFGHPGNPYASGPLKHQAPQLNRPRRPIIEEPNFNDKPYVVDPDDEAGGRRSNQTYNYSYQSSSVTYGGANGASYTSSTTRRTGSDGLTIEESKEADTASGQASYQLHRAIHDKGHTVAMKQNSDGRVDKMQTLHNLNKEELPGFDEDWEGKARKAHLPGRGDERLYLHDGNQD